MLVAGIFTKSRVENYGKHTEYTDGGTSYPESCNVLRFKLYLHSSFEKSRMERVPRYLKNRTDSFDD